MTRNTPLTVLSGESWRGMRLKDRHSRAFSLCHQPPMMQSANLNPCLSRVRTAHPRFCKSSLLLPGRSKNISWWGGDLFLASAIHHCLGQFVSLLSANFILHLPINSSQEPLPLNTFPNSFCLRFLLLYVFYLVLRTELNLLATKQFKKHGSKSQLPWFHGHFLSWVFQPKPHHVFYTRLCMCFTSLVTNKSLYTKKNVPHFPVALF